MSSDALLRHCAQSTIRAAVDPALIAARLEPLTLLASPSVITDSDSEARA